MNITSRPNLLILLVIKKLAAIINKKIKISKFARSIRKAVIGDIKIENMMKFSNPDFAPNNRCNKTSALIIKIRKRKPTTSAWSALMPKKWKNRMSENP
jgi:hypothetical protein